VRNTTKYIGDFERGVTLESPTLAAFPKQYQNIRGRNTTLLREREREREKSVVVPL
jgi:hypothetical protein